MPIFSLEDRKRTEAWKNYSPAERREIEAEYGIEDTTKPTLGQRILGNLQLGVGDAAAGVVGAARLLVSPFSEDVGGGVDRYGRTSLAPALDKARKNIEEYYGGFEAAKQVTEHPAESFIGQTAEGLVRFAPQIPLWVAGEAPISAGLKLLGSAPKLGRLAGFSRYLSEAPKGPIQEYLGVATRGAMTGAEVGAITAKPGERLEKAEEEALGFAIAAPAFHGAGKLLKYGIKAGVEKVTPKWYESQPDISSISAKYSLGTNEAGEVMAFKGMKEAKTYAETNYADRPWKVVRDRTTGRAYVGLDRPVEVKLEGLKAEDIDSVPEPETLKVNEDGTVSRVYPDEVKDKEYDIDYEEWIKKAEQEESLISEPSIDIKPEVGPLSIERDRVLQEALKVYPGDPNHITAEMARHDANAKVLGISLDEYYGRLRFEPGELEKLPPLGTPETHPAYTYQTPDKKVAVGMFSTADVSALVHEHLHVFENQLVKFKELRPDLLVELNNIYANETPAMLKWIAKNKPNETLPQAKRDYLATAFEKWNRNPKTTSPELDSYFSKFRTWLLEVYKSVKNNMLEGVKISPEMDKFFRSMTDSEFKEIVVKATMPKVKAPKVEVPKVEVPGVEIAPEEPAKSWEKFELPAKTETTLVSKNQKAKKGEKVEAKVIPEDEVKGLALSEQLKKDPLAIKNFTGEQLYQLEKTKDWDIFLSDPVNREAFLSHLTQKQVVEWDKFRRVKNTPVVEETEPGFYGEYKSSGVMSVVDRLEALISDEKNILYQTVPNTEKQKFVGYVENVKQILESGREVSVKILRDLKDVDPFFKEAYEAKKAKIAKENKLQREFVVSQSAERAFDIMDSDIKQTKAQQYRAKIEAQFGKVLDGLKGTKGAGEGDFENAAMLQERVSDGLRLLDDLVTASKYPEVFNKAVPNTDLESVSLLEKLTNMSLSPQEHFAGVILPDGKHVGGILDIFRSAELLLKKNPEALAKERESSLILLDTINKAYERIVSWHGRINQADPNLFKENQYIRLLRKSDGFIEDMWKTGLSTKNSTMWGMYKNIISMHWMAKDYPVLQPMYEAAIDELHRTTILAGDIIKGDVTNIVKFKGRDVRLKGFEDFITLRDLDKEAYDITAKLLWEGDKVRKSWNVDLKSNGDRFIDNELVRAKVRTENPTLSEGQVERITRAYESVRDTFDWMYGKTLESLLGKADTPKKVKAVEKLLAERLNYYEGYMPHMRRGKWSVGVFEKTREHIVKEPFYDEDGNLLGYREHKGSTPVEFHQAPNLAELRAMESKLRDKYPQYNVRRLTPDEDANISTSSRKEAAGILKSIFEEASSSPDIAKQKYAAEMLDRSIAELTDLGFFTHFKTRALVDVPGYDTRAGAVMLRTAQEFAKFVSRSEFSEKGWGELSRLREAGAGYGKLYNYAADWFDTMLQPGTGVDKILARARSLIFLKALGFNIKSAFITIAEKATNAPFMLGRYSEHGAAQNMKGIRDIVGYNRWKVEANKHIIKMRESNPNYSMADAINDIGTKSKFFPEELQVMYDLSHQGDLRAQYTEEISGLAEARYDTIEDPLSSGLARAHDYVEKAMSGLSRTASFLISNAERMGRESTGLAAFRIFRYEKGYSYDYAKQMAANLVRDIHYQYGKINQPTWMQKGVGKVAKLALTFRTQEMNYLNMLYHLWGTTGTEGRKAVVKSLGVLGALGGVSSLPFVYATNEFFKKFYGTSPLEYVRQKITSQTDSEWLASIVNDGAPAALGITIQPSLRVASDSTLSEALGGVSLSVGKDLWDAKSALQERDYMTFLEKALPAAGANPLKAYDRWEYGAITGRGRALSDELGGEPTKLNTYEAILNGMGFAPGKIVRAQSKQGMRIADEAYWSGQRKKVYAVIRRGLTKGDSDMINRGFEKLSDYNQSAPPDKMITPQAVLQSLQDRPGMREMMAETRLFGQ